MTNWGGDNKAAMSTSRFGRAKMEDLKDGPAPGGRLRTTVYLVAFVVAVVLLDRAWEAAPGWAKYAAGGALVVFFIGRRLWNRSRIESMESALSRPAPGPIEDDS